MHRNRRFRNTFDQYPIAEEYLGIVEGYVVYGLNPGGMFTSIFANDVHRAVLNSHPHNDWGQLKTLMVWIQHHAPPGCFGDYDTVDSWCQLSDIDRTKILNDLELLDTLFDVIKHTPAY